MRLEEIMNMAVGSVPPQLRAEDAWSRMRAEHVRHLAVMEAGRLVGILSERDLGATRGAAVRKNRVVRELMTPRVVTATPRTTVKEAANLLRGHVIGCLPIIEGKNVVGIVTTTDLLDLIGRGAMRPVTTSQRWLLKARGPRKRGAIEVAAQRTGKRHGRTRSSP